jgi:oligopeptide transport system permease protein
VIPFLIRRIFIGLITLFVVISLTFLLMRIMPGGPFDKERKLPPAIEKNLLEKYKLNGTLWQQYSDYISDVFLHWDLRLSLKYRNRSVNEIIAQTLPISATLGSISFVIALFLGLFLGSIAAIRHKTLADQFSMLFAVLSISIPAFVIAPLLILFFALKWNLLPVGGWDSARHMVLPSICLALPYSAYIARLIRNSLLDVLNQDYIRTARAKGVSESRVIYVHAMKVAILPVVSFAGPLAAYLITGSLVIEQIFNIPGIGPFFVNAVLNRDAHMVGGTVIIYSALLIFFNIVVDILYTFLDRRIKLA